MAYTHVTLLAIYAWDRLVGAVLQDDSSRALIFEYDDSWVRTGIELSPAQMPLPRRTGVVYSFPGLPESTFHRLPTLLADSVPDRFGNAVIDAALAREGVTPSQVTPLDRLAYIGHRGMGALTFVPDNGPSSEPPTPLILKELVEEARSAVAGTLSEDGGRDTLHALLAVGSSAGGARAKAVVAWNRDTQELRAGNLPAPEGFEQWLLKFDGVENSDKGRTFGATQEWGRIEYAYSQMARAAGIDVPETGLIEEGGRAHFVIRRFDRPWGEQRLHMQTLCAMDALDYNAIGVHDYASLMSRAIALQPDSGATRQEVLRRVAFNVFGSNNDDHTKNHAFLMDEHGEWSLSPGYDITWAYDPDNRWLRRHLMAVEGKFEDITRSDLEAFADRFDVPDYATVIDQVRDAIARWPEHAADAGVTARRAGVIASRLDAIAARDS